MKPTTSSSATGSFMPDSPSSARASRRRRREPRSTAKIAALSVAATAEPRIRPSSVPRSKSQIAAAPVISAVRTVPRVASETAVPSTGRISVQPALRPPSNRIRTRPMVPSVRVSSASSNSTPPMPSEPASIPRPRNSSRPGTRTRSATFAAASPIASSSPAIRISSWSGIAPPTVLARLVGQRQPRLDLLRRARRELVPGSGAGIGVRTPEQRAQDRRGGGEADLDPPCRVS